MVTRTHNVAHGSIFQHYVEETGTISATNDIVGIDVRGYTAVGMSASGTYSGKVKSQGRVGQAPWETLEGFTLNVPTTLTEMDSLEGSCVFPVAGLSELRVIGADWVSGSASITLVACGGAESKALVSHIGNFDTDAGAERRRAAHGIIIPGAGGPAIAGIDSEPLRQRSGFNDKALLSKTDFDHTASGETVIVAAVAGKQIFVYGMAFSILNTGITGNLLVRLHDGGTIEKDLFTFRIAAEQGGFTTMPISTEPWFISDEALELETSDNAVKLTGSLWYKQV